MGFWYRRWVVAVVGCLAVVVLQGGVTTVLRYRAGYPVGLFQVLDQSSAEGRRELRALRKEAILRFRPTGADHRRTTERAAGKDLWGADQPTTINQLLFISPEPGEAVDAYRIRGEATGWTLVRTSCSYFLRSTMIVMSKVVDDHPAMLEVYGSGERGILTVFLTAEAPRDPPQGPEGAGLRHRDVHCLRTFDPNSPDLRPPARQPDTSVAICALMTSAEVRTVVPTIERLEADTNDARACRYVADRGPTFSAIAATEPRARYDDKRSSRDPGDPRYLLVEEGAPGSVTGAWVDTRLGPVRLTADFLFGRPPLDVRQLVALAQLLARR